MLAVVKAVLMGDLSVGWKELLTAIRDDYVYVLKFVSGAQDREALEGVM